MTSLWLEADDASTANPLDIAEQLLLDRDWSFDRSETQELLADVTGSWCNYRISLNWHESFGALTFCCEVDSKIPPRMVDRLYPILAKVNSKLWLGHFDLSEESGYLAFRYAMLTKGADVTPTQLEDLLDLAVTECERFFPAFQSAIWSDRPVDDMLQMALMETQGEA